MRGLIRDRRTNVWVSAALLLAAGLAAGEELYVKKADWPATMLAARARYAEWAASQKKPGGFKPWDSGVLRGDGPGKQVSVQLGSADVMCLAGKVVQGTGNCHIWGDPVLIATDGTRTPLTSLKPMSIKVGWGKLMLNRNWQNNPLRIGGKRGLLPPRRQVRTVRGVGRLRQGPGDRGGAVPGARPPAQRALGPLAARREGLPHGGQLVQHGPGPPGRRDAMVPAE